MHSKRSQPRQHHYLPRFYLDGFCDPAVLGREGKSVIWVYEKGKSVRRSIPGKEARERDFYALEKDGARDIQVEEWLGTVEQHVAPVIRRLRDVRYELSPAEREWVAVFVGTMHMRTPAGRKLMETRVGPAASRAIKEAAKDLDAFRSLFQSISIPVDPDFDLEDVRKGILEGRGDIISERLDFKLASMIHVGRMEAEMLLGFDWQVVHADGSEFFLTSDNPVVSALWEQEGGMTYFHMGFDVPGVDIFFPLDRTLCLRMKKGIEPGPCRVPDRGVRYFNKATVICAHRRAYAAKQSVKLEKLFNRHGGKVPIESVQPMWKGKPI